MRRKACDDREGPSPAETISSLAYLLAIAIDTIFEDHQNSVAPDGAGSRFQFRCRYEKGGLVREYGHGMRFSFRTRDDKVTVLLLYAPANYVYSFTREFDDLKEACFEEIGPHEDWVLTGYHDSCWRDKVRKFVLEHAERLETVGWLRFGDKVAIGADMYEFMLSREKEHRLR